MTDRKLPEHLEGVIRTVMHFEDNFVGGIEPGCVNVVSHDAATYREDCLLLTSRKSPEGFSHGGLPNGGEWPQPVLLGVEFPWYISQDGFTYRSSGRIIPTVELELVIIRGAVGNA